MSRSSNYGGRNFALSDETLTEAVVQHTEERESGLPHLPRSTVEEESGEFVDAWFVCWYSVNLTPCNIHTFIETRLAQFLDGDDHIKCVQANKQALLSEKLERLRALKDEITKENWMFAPNTFSSNGSMRVWK